MNSKADKVAIVDLVGRGNGAMDYYDLALQDGFKHNNYKCFIYSNFIANELCIKRFAEKRTSAIQKIFNYLIGYTRSFWSCRQKGIKYVILHYFQGTVQDLFPYVLAKSLGLQTITIVHDIVSMANNDISAMRDLILNKYSDHLVVHNEYSKRQLLDVIAEKRFGDVHVIHHGAFMDLIDEKVDRAFARKKLKHKNDGKYLLFFGKIKTTKGLDVLLNAMSGVADDVQLLVAGSPWKDDFKKYRKIISDKGLEQRIILNIDYISDEYREYYFKAADALVLPYREIFQSGVLLMSLSYSLPVVASDLDSNKEIIEDNYNGVLFRSENEKDLADKINGLMGDPDLLQKIRENCLKTIEDDYNWTKIAREYIRLIN